MGQIGIWQIVIVAVVIVLLFGRGKISSTMGELAKGITQFKKGLKDEDKDTAHIDDKGDKVVDSTIHEKSKTTS